MAVASVGADGAIRRIRPGWAMEERERASVDGRERERGRGKNRVPPFNWMPMQEINFPKVPLVAPDSFRATGCPDCRVHYVFRN